MAQQSYLEQIGIDEREKEQVRGTYSENNEYSETHPDALASSGKGKGTGTPLSALSLKDVKKGRYDQFSGWGETMNTSEDAGSLYDKEGTKGVEGAFQGDAGRTYLLNSLNKYNEGNEYGQESIDTTKQIPGQYWVK